MIALLFCLFIAAAAAELAGVVLLVLDVRQDGRDLRTLIEAQRHASTLSDVSATRTLGGTGLVRGSISGFGFAPIAQSSARSDALVEFVTTRLAGSFRKRWIAIGLLFAGILIGAAANLLSLFI